MTRHVESRLYINPELSVKVLEDLYSTNKEIFSKFEVDSEIYGKYN